MLLTSIVKIESRTKGLLIEDWTIRQVTKEEEGDSGFRFQALVKNSSSATFGDSTYELRYFNSAGKFLGVDEGFSIFEELQAGHDRTITISLNIPIGVSQAKFVMTAQRSTWFEKNSFLLFGAALVVAAIFYFLKAAIQK